MQMFLQLGFQYVFNFDVFNASFELVKNEDMKARWNLFFF